MASILHPPLVFPNLCNSKLKHLAVTECSERWRGMGFDKLSHLIEVTDIASIHPAGHWFLASDFRPLISLCFNHRPALPARSDERFFLDSSEARRAGRFSQSNFSIIGFWLLIFDFSNFFSASGETSLAESDRIPKILRFCERAFYPPYYWQ